MAFDDEDGEPDEDDLDDEDNNEPCRNQLCPLAGTSPKRHTSGYCHSCCPVMGPLECVDCGWDDGDDE